MTFARIDPSGFPGSGASTGRQLRGGGGHGAEDRPGELRATRADEAGQPDDLAGPDLERRPGDAGGREVPDRQRDGRVRRRRDLRRIGPADRPAEHRGDERVLGLGGGRPGPDDLAVAQDRDRVGELEDLARGSARRG